MQARGGMEFDVVHSRACAQPHRTASHHRVDWKGRSASTTSPTRGVTSSTSTRVAAAAGHNKEAGTRPSRDRAIDKRRSDPLQRVCVSRGATSRASTSITSLCLARGRDIVPAPRRPKCTARARRPLRSFHASKMKPRTAPDSNAPSSSTRPATAAKSARIPVKAAPVMPFEGPLVRSRLMVSMAQSSLRHLATPVRDQLSGKEP